MSEENRFQHLGFLDVLAASFHHDYCILSSRHDKIDGARIPLIDGRIDPQFPADLSDPHCSHRPLKRHVGQFKRRGRPNQGKNIRIILFVH